MTAQSSEKLIYNGETLWMSDEPLGQYFATLEVKPKLVAPNTACWRGYYGTWAIQNNKLFLTDFKGYIQDYVEVGIDYLFPGDEVVFANWYTGKIRVPKGEMLKYVHGGYESVFEEDLFLEIKEGRLVSTRLVDNRNRDLKDEIDWDLTERIFILYIHFYEHVKDHILLKKMILLGKQPDKLPNPNIMCVYDNLKKERYTDPYYDEEPTYKNLKNNLELMQALALLVEKGISNENTELLDFLQSLKQHELFEDREDFKEAYKQMKELGLSI